MSKQKNKPNYKPTILNKKARHEFQFVDTFDAGISLTGAEIKSVRLAKVQFSEAYCLFLNDELFIYEMYITPYTQGSVFNDDPRRKRKLLLKKRELEKLKTGLEEKGLTVIPVKLYFNDRNYAKLQIALAKGKKLYDKRQDLKEKDSKREISRQLNQQ